MTWRRAANYGRMAGTLSFRNRWAATVLVLLCKEQQGPSVQIADVVGKLTGALVHPQEQLQRERSGGERTNPG